MTNLFNPMGMKRDEVGGPFFFFFLSAAIRAQRGKSLLGGFHSWEVGVMGPDIKGSLL